MRTTEGPDGLLRYRYRADARGEAENAALRQAMAERVPLVWFVGVAPGVYLPRWPVYVVGDDPAQQAFTLALDQEQAALVGPSGQVLVQREYATAITRRRLHQPLFRARVLAAYETHCAVCRLELPGLLDAAHIVGDARDGGEPVVPNGLALCKIHHAAFDLNILGVRPDLVVEVNREVLADPRRADARTRAEGHPRPEADVAPPAAGLPAGPGPAGAALRGVPPGQLEPTVRGRCSRPPSRGRRPRGPSTARRGGHDSGAAAASEAERARSKAQEYRERAERLERRAEVFDRGQAGELRVAQALDRLLPAGYARLDDVRWPGTTKANIDHVVFGPGGMFVVDAKNWTGQVVVRAGVLRQNGYRRTRETNKVLRMTADLQAHLGASVGAVPAGAVSGRPAHHPTRPWPRG